MKKMRAWLFPIVFLLGYLVAWGSILVDRQMVMDEQRELVGMLEEMKKIVVIRELIDEFGYTWDEMIHWNRKSKAYERKLIPPKEAPGGQVDK